MYVYLHFARISKNIYWVFDMIIQSNLEFIRNILLIKWVDSGKLEAFSKHIEWLVH